MPTYPVTVHATFKKIDYTISVVDASNEKGSFTVDKTVAQIKELIAQHDVGELVMGLPKNMDGTEGARAELCRSFAEELKEATGLHVAMWDERRTTVEAHNILTDNVYVCRPILLEKLALNLGKFSVKLFNFCVFKFNLALFKFQIG